MTGEGEGRPDASRAIEGTRRRRWFPALFVASGLVFFFGILAAHSHSTRHLKGERSPSLAPTQTPSSSLESDRPQSFAEGNSEDASSNASSGKGGEDLEFIRGAHGLVRMAGSSPQGGGPSLVSVSSHATSLNEATNSLGGGSEHLQESDTQNPEANPSVSAPPPSQTQNADLQTPPHLPQTHPLLPPTQPVSTGPQIVSPQTQPVSTGPQTVSPQTQPVSTGPQTVSPQTQPVSTGPQTVYSQTQPVSTGPQTVPSLTHPVSTGPQTVYPQTQPLDSSAQLPSAAGQATLPWTQFVSPQTPSSSIPEQRTTATSQFSNSLEGIPSAASSASGVNNVYLVSRSSNASSLNAAALSPTNAATLANDQTVSPVVENYTASPSWSNPSASQETPSSSPPLQTPDASPNAPDVSDRQTARAVLEAESEISNEFCFDRCLCWPVWALGVVVFVVYLIATMTAIAMSAMLFSKGFFSLSFMRGGGFWLLGMAGVGAAVGGLVGGLVSKCVAGGLALSGGSLALFCAVVLVGKRGAWLGALGGLLTGTTVGALTKKGGIAIGLGGAVGLLLGVVLGFAPFARELKINERYIRKGIKGSRSSLQGDGDSTGPKVSSVERRNSARRGSSEQTSSVDRSSGNRRPISSLRSRSFLGEENSLPSRLRSHSAGASDEGVSDSR